ncbi:uncharacterized protein DAT39_014978, partial [Clarias magur]
MESCRVPHQILLFFILMFITGSLSVFTNIWIEFNQSAALPCKHNCPSLVKWTLSRYSDDDVVAECDQTSCRSLKERFNMSHDQYLNGDLTLIITAADHRMRGLYTCQCDGKGVNDVDLRIRPTISSIDLNSGEDLQLDLHGLDQVEVVHWSIGYSSFISGLWICSVKGSSLDCTPDNTQRASLNNSVFTLRGPVSAKTIRWVKPHQSAALPCKHNCPGLAKWTQSRYPGDDAVAECDQTSCRSLREGFTMSHDQYLNGDLTLIITAADHSLSDLYTCQCKRKSINEVDLSLEPFIWSHFHRTRYFRRGFFPDPVIFYPDIFYQGFSSLSLVSIKSGEDLLLDLHRSDQVKVIYKGVEICSVDRSSLHCTAKYTLRTSLSNTVLTLRGVKPRDGGVYTVQDTESNENLHICTVSVRGPVSAKTIRWVKPHQSAALPCKHNCPGLAKWTQSRYPGDDAVAECDQTSCRSLREGFTMSHDQYLNGDLTLIITAADHSLSGLYTCQCKRKSINEVDLSLE